MPERDVVEILNNYSRNIDIFIKSVLNRVPAQKAVSCFNNEEIDSSVYAGLVQAAECLPVEERMRVFGCAAPAATAEIKELLEKKSLRCVAEMIGSGTPVEPLYRNGGGFVKDSAELSLPLRVNWCGTWSDTPPYCLENGGAVVNAAVSVDGTMPVNVRIQRIDEPKAILEYSDSGERGELGGCDTIESLADPMEPLPLIKAALMVSGIIPMPGVRPEGNVFEKLGGGLSISAGAPGIPKGSGLGTSSILLAACVKALLEFTGREIDGEEVCRRVLLAEQLMGTGGGWQDQAGALTPGIKIANSKKGFRQQVKCERLNAPPAFIDELKERFCLVYSGKRRLGRTILREMMGGYIRSDPLYLKTLGEIHALAGQMKSSIEAGDMERFLANLNSQTRLTKKLDTGYSNEHLETILSSCAALTDAAMICGAGGGGFMQIFLKKGFSREDLNGVLNKAFPGRDIGVRPCELL